MNILKTALLIMLIVFFAGSCSVVSQQVRTEAIPPVHFQILLQEADKYIGDTVTLGGYILEIKNFADESIVKVLQAPLGFREEPKSKDHSEGRFIVSKKGFLDPEVYSKDRKITVAGTIVGTVVEKIDGSLYKYLKIESREIYLWPEYRYYDHTPYYDPWYYPHPFYRYHHHPYYWW
jgi:outer membrane lipoprotein